MWYRRTLLSKGGDKLDKSIRFGPPPAIGEAVVMRLAGLMPRVVMARVTKVEPLTSAGDISHEVELVETS